jgi:hypothetical protein
VPVEATANIEGFVTLEASSALRQKVASSLASSF